MNEFTTQRLKEALKEGKEIMKALSIASAIFYNTEYNSIGAKIHLIEMELQKRGLK